MIKQDKNKFVGSTMMDFPLPSVIKLKRFIHIPHKDVVLSKKNILRRDSYKCGYCGRNDIHLTLDHIMPRSRGGTGTWLNLVTACRKCNNKKGDRTPVEANMPLLVNVNTPNHIMFIRNSVARVAAEWEPYLNYNS